MKLTRVSKISLIAMISFKTNPATNTTSRGLMLKTRVILPTGPMLRALKNKIEFAQKKIHNPTSFHPPFPTLKKLIPQNEPQINIAVEKMIVRNAMTSNPLR